MVRSCCDAFLLVQDWIDEVGEKELANKDKGIITISSFFILTSQQGQGLGK